MPDMNPFATGYGQQQQAGPLGQANPMAGQQAPQKATSMPGAIGQMVSAIKGGLGDYQKKQAMLPGMSTGPSPDFPSAPGGPQLGMSPDFPPAPGGAPGGLPGPVATMPPMMPPGGAVPFAAETAGLPAGGGGMGIMDMMQGQGMPTGGLMDLFGGGGGMSPQDLSMAALFGGGGGGF